MPKVSVCIPSYNLARYIGQAIESVLAQTFGDFELLIEDDCSTDDSIAVINRYQDPRISLTVKTANEGANKTTNNLVAQAKGEYIALLSADDFWEPAKLAKQVEFMDTHPECGLCFTWPQVLRDDGSFHEFKEHDLFRPHPIAPDMLLKRMGTVGNTWICSSLMYRARLHEKVSHFDESLSLLADFEFYVKSVHAGYGLHTIEEPLTIWRQRAGSLSCLTPETGARHYDEMEIIKTRHFREKPKKEKYLIATPFYEVKGYSPYIRSLVHSLKALSRFTDWDWEYLEHAGDSYVWRARNTIADHFLKTDCSHLIFIDSDMSWDTIGFFRLLKAPAGCDVIGAAYPTKNNWDFWGVEVALSPDGQLMGNKASGVIEARKVPTGFMRISRRVFEKLREAYPENWYWQPQNGVMAKIYNYFGHTTTDQHQALGEDISFCKRWTDIGGKLWIEPRVTITHYGVKGWAGEYNEYMNDQLEAGRNRVAA